MSEKVLQTISMDKEILSAIKQELNRIGHGANLSGWISQACKEKIENKNCGIEIVIGKLKKWINTFPRTPIKQLISDLESEYNGKI